MGSQMDTDAKKHGQGQIERVQVADASPAVEMAVPAVGSLGKRAPDSLAEPSHCQQKRSKALQAPKRAAEQPLQTVAMQDSPQAPCQSSTPTASSGDKTCRDSSDSASGPEQEPELADLPVLKAEACRGDKTCRDSSDSICGPEQGPEHADLPVLKAETCPESSNLSASASDSKDSMQGQGEKTQDDASSLLPSLEARLRLYHNHPAEYLNADQVSCHLPCFVCSASLCS